MNIRRVQGLALIIGAACWLITLFGSENVLMQYLGLLALLLFIFGIPAVNSMQPTGILGLLGIGLMILAALIALGFRVGLLGDTPYVEALIILSAVSGLMGRLLTGWLTIREHVFSAWLGWGLIAEGIISIAGFLDLPSLATAHQVVVTVLTVAVMSGYGIQIFQKSAAQTVTS